MLLIIRGGDPKEEVEVYAGFCEHIIQTGLVKDGLKGLIKAAKEKNYNELLRQAIQVRELTERVNFLYDNMDNSFQFKVSQGSEEVEAKIDTIKPNLVKDFRGVVCPMNFVKTKIELSKIKSGEVLNILLDDGEPIENVPASVKAEGHKILKQEKINNYWSVVIEKA